MRIFQDTDWSIEIYKDWYYKIDKSCVSFHAQDGHGALQISSYTRTFDITVEEIINLADFDDEDPLHLSKISLGEFEGVQLIFSDEDGTFWRKHWVKNNRLLLFITYNCLLENADYEKAVIYSMLHTLRCNKAKVAPL